jgi:hypothetical protein
VARIHIGYVGQHIRFRGGHSSSDRVSRGAGHSPFAFRILILSSNLTRMLRSWGRWGIESERRIHIGYVGQYIYTLQGGPQFFVADRVSRGAGHSPFPFVRILHSATRLLHRYLYRYLHTCTGTPWTLWCPQGPALLGWAR